MKLRWPNWKEWDSPRFVVTRHCSQQVIAILRPRWSGFSLIWMTLVCSNIPYLIFVSLKIISFFVFHLDIDSPIQLSAPAAGNEPDADQVAMLSDMGFTSAQARRALRETCQFAGSGHRLSEPQRIGWRVPCNSLGNSERNVEG